MYKRTVFKQSRRLRYKHTVVFLSFAATCTKHYVQKNPAAKCTNTQFSTNPAVKGTNTQSLKSHPWHAQAHDVQKSPAAKSTNTLFSRIATVKGANKQFHKLKNTSRDMHKNTMFKKSRGEMYKHTAFKKYRFVAKTLCSKSRPLNVQTHFSKSPAVKGTSTQL